MKTYGLNDTVFARASMFGQELLNVRICGVSSHESLVARVREELGSFIGLVSLNVRNLTQGWADTKYYSFA